MSVDGFPVDDLVRCRQPNWILHQLTHNWVTEVVWCILEAQRVLRHCHLFRLEEEERTVLITKEEKHLPEGLLRHN